MSKDKIGLLNMELSMKLDEGFGLEVLYTQTFKNLLDVTGTEKKLEETLQKINNEIQDFLNVIDEEVDQINDYMMDNIEKLIDENSK